MIAAMPTQPADPRAALARRNRVLALLLAGVALAILVAFVYAQSHR